MRVLNEKIAAEQKWRSITKSIAPSLRPDGTVDTEGNDINKIPRKSMLMLTLQQRMKLLFD